MLNRVDHVGVLRPCGRRAIAGAIPAVIAPHLLGAPSQAAATIQTTTFASTSTEQTFTVPLGVTRVHVVAIGGHGGDAFQAPGGFGATATADLPVTAGKVLYIEVAGNGGASPDAAPGGYNGGGGAGPAGVSGSGAGASGVRTLAAAAPDSLASRLIVAAGGGGGALGGPGGAAGACGAASPSSGGAGGSEGGGVGGRGLVGQGAAGALGQGGAGARNVGPRRWWRWRRPLRGWGGAGANSICSGMNSCSYGNPGGGGGGSSGFGPGTSNTTVAPDVTGAPSVSLTYDVVPPSNAFSFPAPTAAANGIIALRVSVPSIGAVKVLARVVSTRRGAHRATSLQTVLTYGTRAVRAPRVGALTLHVKPTLAARRLLAKRGRLRVAVAVTFKPDGGTARTRTTTLTITAATKRRGR